MLNILHCWRDQGYQPYKLVMYGDKELELISYPYEEGTKVFIKAREFDNPITCATYAIDELQIVPTCLTVRELRNRKEHLITVQQDVKDINLELKTRQKLLCTPLLDYTDQNVNLYKVYRFWYCGDEVPELVIKESIRELEDTKNKIKKNPEYIVEAMTDEINRLKYSLSEWVN
jgi:hypothetical protein